MRRQAQEIQMLQAFIRGTGRTEIIILPRTSRKCREHALLIYGHGAHTPTIREPCPFRATPQGPLKWVEGLIIFFVQIGTNKI